MDDKVRRILFLSGAILGTSLLILAFFGFLFGSTSDVKITNLSMLHGWERCNADFDIVNDGDSDRFVEIVFFEPHFTFDREKIIHKSEFYVPAHTTQNKTMSFFFSPCSQDYTDVRINLIDKE